MRHALKLHPDSRCDAVSGIEVEIARAGDLLLRYVVTGKPGDLVIPAIAAPRRADELWRDTCFEAFLREPSGEGYIEFNFSPSAEWAVYRLDAYRVGRRIAEGIAAPRITLHPNTTGFELQASLELPDDSAWRLGLAAVIEEAGGRISYWALTHPPGKADFHHSDCFALELAATLAS